ncbi:hypothetical protein JTE90_021964 [Oedothorax gibbosus]|uniref:Uncharacterized protein n=1 Tax=Oedothorax gibbosus TaxID=931172 RepID=A0AAV6V3D9_9ARAC|nr:hypothetical protein JTE90_021964 [Oedothorax gibbosus]
MQIATWESYNAFGKKSDPWESHTMHFGKKSDSWDSHNTMHFGKKSDPWDSHNTMHFGKRSDAWDSHNTMHFGKRSDPWDSHNTMHFGKRSDPWDSHKTLHFGKKSEWSGNQSSLNSDLPVGNTNGASTFPTVPQMMYLDDSQEIRLKWNEYLSQLLKEGTISDSEVQSLKQYLTSLLQKGYISPEEPAFRNEQILLEFLGLISDSEDTSNKIQQAEYEEGAADMDGDPDPQPGMKAVNKRYWAPFQGPKSIIYPHAWFASQIRRSVPGMEGARMFETRMAEKKEDPVNSFMHFGKR